MNVLTLFGVGLVSSGIALLMWDFVSMYRSRRVKRQETAPSANQTAPVRQRWNRVGANLLWIAQFFFEPDQIDAVLRPTIDDLRTEYAEALVEVGRVKAEWVRVRGTWAVVCAGSLLALTSFGKLIARLWWAGTGRR